MVWAWAYLTCLGNGPYFHRLHALSTPSTRSVPRHPQERWSLIPAKVHQHNLSSRVTVVVCSRRAAMT